MINKIALFLLFFVISSAAISASTDAPAKTGRPTIPGTFVMEFGFNRDMTGPDNFSLNFWGSRTVNLYYQYDIRILKSRISFVPGIGVSLERFKFKKVRTLAYTTTDSLKLVESYNQPSNIETFVPTAVKKSQLITNYIEVPLELKYSSNPDDPARTFKISVGGRVGYLFDSFTKMKYKEDHEWKKLKNNQDFNLTKLRYGVSAKVGFGNFSLFAYYNLTNLFQSGKGPYIKGVQDDFPTGTVGISLSSF